MIDRATVFRWGAIAGRVVAMLALVVAFVYLLDDLSIRLKIPASREAFGQVRITSLLAVPLKNGRLEFMPNGSEERTCVNSPFPHLGFPPCWYLRRHKNLRQNL